MAHSAVSDSPFGLPLHYATHIQSEGKGYMCVVFVEPSIWQNHRPLKVNAKTARETTKPELLEKCPPGAHAYLLQ